MTRAHLVNPSAVLTFGHSGPKNHHFIPMQACICSITVDLVRYYIHHSDADNLT